MFGTSAKAKAAEAPGVISNWETLQSSYVQERSQVGAWTDIGFRIPEPNPSGLFTQIPPMTCWLPPFPPPGTDWETAIR